MAAPITENFSVPQQPNRHEREKSHVDLGVEVIKPGEVGWDEATEFEAATFKGRGFVGSKEELGDEYKAYEPEATMLVIKKPEGGVAACSRVIEYNSDIGFKTINDARDEDKTLTIDEKGWEKLKDIDPANTFEVGTVSAYPTVGAELFGMIIAHGINKEPQREYIVASLDQKVLERIIKPIFGDSVKMLGPAVEYIGSQTVPILIDLARAYDNAITNNQFPQYAAKVKHGKEALVHHEP